MAWIGNKNRCRHKSQALLLYTKRLFELQWEEDYLQREN